MVFGIKEITGCLEDFKPAFYEYCEASRLTSAATLAASSDPLCLSTLHIVSSADELSRFQNCTGCSFVACFSYESVHFDVDSFCRERKLDAAFLASSPSPEEVHACLSSAITESFVLARFSAELLEILFRDGSVQNLVDMSYKYFENPVNVFDAGYQLVAATWDYPNKDVLSEKIFRNRFLDSDDMKVINYQDTFDKVRKSTRPILIQHKKLNSNRIVSNINTRKDIGTLVVIEENQPFQEIDFRMVELLRNSIDMQMNRDNFILHAKGFNYEFFIKDLLDGKFVIKPGKNKRADYIDEKFPDPVYCLVVEPSRSIGALPISFVRNGFESMFSGIITVFYNGHLVIVISGKNKAALTEDDVALVNKFCSINELYCGMSNAFKNMARLPEYYKQALRAIQVGATETGTPGLFVYNNYFLKHIASIFLQKADADVFCCPQMSKLLEYDKNKGKDLAKTLYMYLLHGSTNAAASAMFIHRNTMLYRVGLINELVSIDYNDPMLRQYLILSYEMMSYSMMPNDESQD